MEKLFDESDWFADSVADQWIALPHPARACFALFTDLPRWREWLPVLSKVGVTGPRPRSGPSPHPDQALSPDVAMTLVMMKVMLGCRLRFEVDHVRMTVRWESHASSRFRWSGAVAFEPSGGRACVLRFRIDTSFARDVGLAVPPPDGRSFMECFKLFARGVLPMFAEGSAPHVRPLPPAETAAAVPRRPPPPPPEAMRARPAPTPGPAASPMAASARLAAGALRLPLPAPAVPGAGAMELSDGANKWLT